MEIKRVAIVGAGALGIMMGEYCIKKLGQENVVFLADKARIARYEREGIFSNGQRCDFRFGDDKNAVSADLIIFAVKAGSLAAAIDLARLWVGENTILISLINGVTSEDTIGSALGAEKVIHTVAQGMDATRDGNRLIWQMPGELRIGYLPSEEHKQPRLDALTAFLRKMNFAHTVEADIRHRLWGKLMFNVGVNQCCTVFDCDYGGVQRPGEARDTLLAAMEEVRTVARFVGVALTEKDRDMYLALMDRLTPSGMPSMQQDALAGRPTELSLFAGTVIDYAERYGVDVPVNRFIAESILRMEASKGIR